MKEGHRLVVVEIGKAVSHTAGAIERLVEFEAAHVAAPPRESGNTLGFSFQAIQKVLREIDARNAVAPLRQADCMAAGAAWDIQQSWAVSKCASKKVYFLLRYG